MKKLLGAVEGNLPRELLVKEVDRVPNQYLILLSFQNPNFASYMISHK